MFKSSELVNIRDSLTYTSPFPKRIPRRDGEGNILFGKGGMLHNEEWTTVEAFEEDENSIAIPYNSEVSVSRGGNLDLHSVQLSSGIKFPPPPKLPDPSSKYAWDGQDKLFQSAVDTVSKRVCSLLEAGTGMGKTVTCLYVAGKLNVSTLVIVPSVNLMNQWIEEAKKHLGITDEEIGIVQGSKADYKGKRITFAVIHNLIQKDLGEEFFNHFGLAIWDEVHRVAATSFSRTLKLVTSKHRLAVTATPDRKDGLWKVVQSQFGKPSIVAKAKPLHCRCYLKGYDWGSQINSLSRMPRARLINKISECDVRNRKIVALVNKAYKKGRVILVLSDRIKQLQFIHKELLQLGIDIKELGLFIGHTQETYFAEKKSKSGRTVRVSKVRKVKVRKDELDRIKKESKIVLATYNMMKEGTDIRRLDFGIDATPISEGTQAIGRIRRPDEGKKTPVWFTVVDNIPQCQRWARTRIKEYECSNVEIVNGYDKPKLLKAITR